MIELGRYLVGEAGIYVCRVIDRKISRGHVFLVTDGGLHHHLAASGNFGQVIRKNYPVVVGNRVGRQRARNRLGGRPAVHAARPARRQHGNGDARCRRPDRRVPVGRLRAHREPDRLPQPSGAGRSACVGVSPTYIASPRGACGKLANLPQTDRRAPLAESVVDEVVLILRDVLRLGSRADDMNAATPLLGAIPEMDSMAVVSVVTALEEHFGFAFDDDEISGETFEKIGNLAALVESKLNA